MAKDGDGRNIKPSNLQLANLEKKQQRIYQRGRYISNITTTFDEYFNYPFWENHEYKAFQEFVNENKIEYKYLCYSSKKFGSKVAVRILKRTANKKHVAL